MEVRELQEKLAKLDPTVAKLTRLDDGTPYLKFGQSSSSTASATMEVTSEF